MNDMNINDKVVPICERFLLTIKEVSLYFNTTL